jgi:hypothetical protein
MKNLALLAVLALPTTDFSPFCTQMLQPEPRIENYATRFTAGFRAQVSIDQLKAVFREAYGEVGKCTSFTAIPRGPGQYQLKLTGEKGLNALFFVGVDEPSAQFRALLSEGLEDPAVRIDSWDDVGRALEKLPGKAAAALLTADHQVMLTGQGTEAFAIGSTFKLYILGALEQAVARGEHRWDGTLPLREEWKSLPSGILHTWPAGSSITLLEYATKMISISDNTATDHLLYFLGRDRVEAMLPMMNNRTEASYLPFLSTLEMFKLKWALDPADAGEYLAAGVTERRAMLERLRQVPRTAVGANGIPLSQPRLIDRLEWFATPAENCEAMLWLGSRKSPEVRQVLSRNVPLIGNAGQEISHWAFAGYKGGSESGVLSMTFLLESKNGNRGCLALSWNNPQAPVSESRFFDVVRKTLKYAEQPIR